MSDSVNAEGLQQLYRTNEHARTVLDHFASRQRNWSTTTVDRLLTILQAEGSAVSRGDLIAVLRSLDELGCGSFVAGRRGHASRFEWRVRMVTVGRAAAGEPTDVEDIADDEKSEEEPESLLLEHKFRLRADHVVAIDLPADLTQAEAARLGDFLRSLPFA